MKFLLIYIFLLSCISFSHAKETIKLQLKWFHSFQFAGYYMAIEKGYYDDLNLNVKLIERDPSKNNITQVINGEAQYGIADSTILLYRANKQPVKIIASIFQHSALVFLSRKTSNIFSPLEMKNKVISYQKGLDDAALLAMLESVNLTESDYIYEPLDFTSQNFIDAEIDVMGAYLSNQPYLLRERGINFNIINPLSYGIDLYGDNLFTTEDEIKNHPHRVKAFQKASLKGWEYALNNIDETIEIIKNKYNSQNSIEHLQYEAKITKELILPDMIEIGLSNKERFSHIANIYYKIGKSDKESLKEAVEEIIYVPKNNNEWLQYFYFIFILFILAISIVFVLFLINKKLNKLVENKTQEQESLLSLFEHSDSVLFKWNNDKHWTISYVSSNVENLLGYTKEEFLSSQISYLDCIHGKDIDHVLKETDDGKHNSEKFFKHDTYRIVTKTGQEKWVLDYTVIIRDTEGEVTHFLGYLLDVTEKETMLLNLEKFIDNQANIVILTDGKKLEFANKQFYRFFEFNNIDSFFKFNNCISEHFIENDRFFHLKKINKDKNWLEAIQELPNEKKIVALLGRDMTIHAFSVRINQFERNMYIVSFTDISQTVLNQISLEKKTLHDKLTGAYNREYFEQNYKLLIDKFAKSNHHTAIALLDIDHFKMVNDTYGHDIGDQVLKDFVECVKKFSRDSDIFVRWGGEEFILILELQTEENLKIALEHIRKAIEFYKMDVVGHITCSIGASIYKENEPIDKTIKRADNAVYAAKKNGRNQVIIH